MADANHILKEIQDRKALPQPQLISPFNLEADKQNQFLIFLKPEVFIDKKAHEIEKTLEFVFEQFDKYDVNVDGAALFSGKALEQYSIMDKHYGVINHLSKNASQTLTEEEKQAIREQLGASHDHDVVGGHEILDTAPLSPNELDEIWSASPSTKIKSGFYTRLMKLLDTECILVNGFRPKQLVHYTDPDHHTLVLLGTADTSWKKLREEMVGDTFPERAHEDSIRGKINRNPKDFGFEKVNVTNNVIHFSAGPTEALFEIDNFLGDSFKIDIIANRAALAKRLQEEGLSEETIKKILTDKELHAEGELKDTPEIVEIIKKRYS